MTLISYAKALAYFRGAPEVGLDDLRQVLPFVLNDKLKPDLDSPFFQAPANTGFRSDRIGWLRQLFDTSSREYDRLDLDRSDPVADLAGELRGGLEGVEEPEVRKRLARIERQITEIGKGGKIYGPLHDDLLMLKSLHQRYHNYLRWLVRR
jgi:hypothetical protein